MIEQLVDRAGQTVAIHGVGVEVASDDERERFIQSPWLTVVVHQVVGFLRVEIVGNHPQFVVVSPPVAVFWSIENGRCWVRAQEVQAAGGSGRAVNQDGEVPKAFRREPENLEFFRRVIGRFIAGIDRQQSPWHVGPKKLLERTGLPGRKREFGKYSHAVLPFVVPKAHRVGGTAKFPVAVQVEASRSSRVDSAHVTMGKFDGFLVCLGSAQVKLLKQVQRTALVVVVELIKEQDIGLYSLDNFGDLPCLPMGATVQVVTQLTCFVPVEGNVVGGDANGGRRLGSRNYWNT